MLFIEQFLMHKLQINNRQFCPALNVTEPQQSKEWTHINIKLKTEKKIDK